MILLLLDKGQNSYEKRNILTRERSVYRYLQKSCGPLEIIPGNIGNRNRRRKEKIVEIFTKTVMEILIAGTVNIHKEETGKSVEALTGRGGKREMNPGTLKTFWATERQEKGGRPKVFGENKIRKEKESDIKD